MAVKQFPQSGSEFDDGTTTLVPTEVLVPDGAIDPVTGVVDLTQVGSGNVQIQFKDEGSNLGSLGTVSSVDFVGGGVTASRASNAVTVTVPATNSQIQFKDQGVDLGSLGTVSSVDFSTGLSASRSSNAVTVIVDPGSSGAVGSLYFDNNNGATAQRINHGIFWKPNVDYSHFFWQFTIKPKRSADGVDWTGYFLSDNDGGAHNLLIGCEFSQSSNSYTITGNIWNGAVVTFPSGPTISFPADHWVKIAVGWDGQSIMLWANGILFSVQAYSGIRFQGGGNDATLFMGGSDHNMFTGNIRDVWGAEGYDRCLFNSQYGPTYFGPTNLSTVDAPDTVQFFAEYSSNVRIHADLSSGFEGQLHPGSSESVQFFGGNSGSNEAYIDANGLPTYEPGDITFNTYVPPAPPTPSGAKVWDSFSRTNRITLTGAGSGANGGFPDGSSNLGSTEGGSLGPLVWSSPASASFPKGCGYVLNGLAVPQALAERAIVVQTTTLRDVDVRISRPLTGECFTGIIFRWIDNTNYYAVYGADSGVILAKMEGGVLTNVAVTIPSGWTTLRAVATGTALDVYSGTTGSDGTFTLRGSYVITNLSSATQHGLFNGDSSIKGVWFYDDFLIK